MKSFAEFITETLEDNASILVRHGWQAQPKKPDDRWDSSDEYTHKNYPGHKIFLTHGNASGGTSSKEFWIHRSEAAGDVLHGHGHSDSLDRHLTKGSRQATTWLDNSKTKRIVTQMGWKP